MRMEEAAGVTSPATTQISDQATGTHKTWQDSTSRIVGPNPTTSVDGIGYKDFGAWGPECSY